MSDTINVTSLVSSRDGEPRVQIEVPRPTVQLDAAEAWDLVRNIVGALGAAETDAFLLSWLDAQGMPGEAIGAAIIDFRRWREDRDPERREQTKKVQDT